MLDNPAVCIEPEDVHPGPIPVTRSPLQRMQHDKLALGQDPFELDMLPWVFPGHAREVVYEPCFTVRYHGVVLNVDLAGILLNRCGRLALVEHEFVKRNDVSSVSIDLRHLTPGRLTFLIFRTSHQDQMESFDGGGHLSSNISQGQKIVFFAISAILRDA
jgi:hypothetical protein